MSEKPKRMDRRKFIYAGLGAVIVIVGGVAAYFATRPPEVVKETVVQTVSGTPTTVVQTVTGTPTTVEKTVVQTISGKPTTVVQTLTSTIEKTIERTVEKTTPKEVMPWEKIKWDKPSWEERLTEVKVGPIPKHWSERFAGPPPLKGEAAIAGYKLPEGWKEAVEGVDKITFLNYGGLPHDPAIELAMCHFEDMTGIRVEGIEMEELTLWLKTVSILTAKSDAIDMLDYGCTTLLPAVVGSGWGVDISFLWPSEAEKLVAPIVKDLASYEGKWYGVPYCMKPFMFFYRPSWLKKATGSDELPKTWLEVAEVSKTLADWARKELGPGNYGYALPGKDHRYVWYHFHSPFYSLGGKVVKKGRMIYDCPEMKKTLELFVKMVQSGAIPKESFGWAWTDPGEIFAKGKCGIIFDGSVNATRFTYKEIAGAIQGDWSCFPPVPYDKGMPPTTPGTPANWGVNPFTHPKKQAAVMLFMDYYRSWQVQWNEAVYEGNECFAPGVYELPETKERLNFPDVRKKTVEAMKMEIYTHIGDTAQKILWEYFQRAALGEISVDEALKTVQKELDRMQ